MKWGWNKNLFLEQIEAIEDVIRSRMIKQRLDPMCLDFGKKRYTSGNMMKKDIRIKEGIDKETAKKIVKKLEPLS